MKEIRVFNFAALVAIIAIALFCLMPASLMAERFNDIYVGGGYGRQGITLDPYGNYKGDGNMTVGGTLQVTGIPTFTSNAFLGGCLYRTGVAGGTIPANRLVMFNAGALVVGTANSLTVVGSNVTGAQVVNTGALKIGYGFVPLVSATAITAGSPLKAADNGRVTHLITAAMAKTQVIKAWTAGGNFGNQPANDGIEVVSSSEADTTQVVTIIGTTNGGTVVVAENVTLTGTTEVATTKVDWGLILAVKMNTIAAGTVTIREASHDQPVTTLAPTALQSGVVSVAAASQGAYNAIPWVVAGGASTKVVGISYTGSDGTTTGKQAVALNNTTPATLATAALLVDEVYVGDVATATTGSVRVGVEDDELYRIGKAFTSVSGWGEAITGWVTP